VVWRLLKNEKKNEKILIAIYVLIAVVSGIVYYWGFQITRLLSSKRKVKFAAPYPKYLNLEKRIWIQISILGKTKVLIRQGVTFHRFSRKKQTIRKHQGRMPKLRR